MTFLQRLRRIRCWLRYYHICAYAKGGGWIGAFRYDCSGVCADCGVVGTGIRGEGE